VLLYDLRCAGTQSYLAVADEFVQRHPPAPRAATA